MFQQSTPVGCAPSTNAFVRQIPTWIGGSIQFVARCHIMTFW